MATIRRLGPPRPATTATTNMVSENEAIPVQWCISMCGSMGIPFRCKEAFDSANTTAGSAAKAARTSGAGAVRPIRKSNERAGWSATSKTAMATVIDPPWMSAETRDATASAAAASAAAWNGAIIRSGDTAARIHPRATTPVNIANPAVL